MHSPCPCWAHKEKGQCWLMEFSTHSLTTPRVSCSQNEQQRHKKYTILFQTLFTVGRTKIDQVKFLLDYSEKENVYGYSLYRFMT